MTALRRADAVAPARRLAGARVAAGALREYPLRMQALELQFAGFAGQLAEFGGRLTAVEGRMDRLDGRMDGLERRMERVEGRLDRVEQRLDRIEVLLERVTVDIAELKGRVSQMPTSFQLVSWGLSLNVGLMIGMSGLVYAVARATLAH